jgi:hypothetical protein
VKRIRLPLDSPIWLTLNEAYRRGYALTNTSDVVVADLQQGLEDGRLHSKIRWLKGVGFIGDTATRTRNQNSRPEELLPSTFRPDFEILCRDNKLRLLSRGSKFISGAAVIYVWGPDLKKFLRTDATSPQPPPPATEVPVERGRKRVHERADLQSAALGLALQRKPGAPEKKPTDVVNELREWCKRNKRKVPSPSTLYDIVAAALRIKPTLKP